MKIAIASFTVILLCVFTVLGIYLFMPAKSTWADDYRQHANSLANDDPLRKTLDPLLADGELSIWEISQLHCGEDRICQMNNFTEVLLSPQSAEMFAQTVLVVLKKQEV